MDTLLAYFLQLWVHRRAESLLVMGAVITIAVSVLIYANSYTPSSTAPNIIISEKKSESNKSRTIVVYIAGAVVKPGMYTLQQGSRLNDLIEVAGGLSEEAATVFIERNFNRARLLGDEDKYYLPHSVEMSNGENVITKDILQIEPIQSEKEKNISINRGSVSDLDTLPGIGAITAQKIIQGRPYRAIDELISKKVVKKSVYETIKSLITL